MSKINTITEADTMGTTELHHWLTEASMLGLAPGQWPEQLPTTLGNGQPFFKQPYIGEGKVEYRQSMGCIRLTVLNT